MISQIIQLGLNGKQIKDICEQGSLHDQEHTEEVPRQALQLVKATKAINTSSATDIAKLLMSQDKNTHIARARVQELRNLLDQVEGILVEQQQK